MKVIHLVEKNEKCTPQSRTWQLFCDGDNCDKCVLKFKCYTERYYLEVDFTKPNWDPVAFLNKLTHSTIRRRLYNI